MVVKLLLSRGTDVNAKDQQGITALMWSVMCDDIRLVRVLLDIGANPNSKVLKDRTRKGETALMMAVGNGHIMNMLISKGADVNARSQDGTTALMKAAGCGCGEVND